MVSAVGFVARFTMHPKLELLLEWGWWRSDLDWIFILTLAGIFLTTLWAGLAMQEAYRDGVTCERWLRYKRRHRNGADMEALFRESYQYEQLADRRGARQTAITIGIIGLGPILVELILVDLYVHRNGFSLYVGGHGVDFFSLLVGLVCFGGLAAFCFALAAAWWAQSRVPQSAPP